MVIYDGLHYDALVRPAPNGEEQRVFYPALEKGVESEVKAIAQELRERKQFEKPSVTRRQEVIRASYKQRMQSLEG